MNENYTYRTIHTSNTKTNQNPYNTEKKTITNPYMLYSAPGKETT